MYPGSTPRPATHPGTRVGIRRVLTAGAAVAVLGVAVLSSPAHAAGPRITLGAAAAYSVIGGQAVTNTGPSTLDRGVALSPGTGLTGFPPGLVAGATHVADAVAGQAQSDLLLAYDEAAGRASDATVAGDLVGLTFTAGTYTSADTLDVTGALALDAQGDPDAVFVFQVASALTTGSASEIELLNGAQSCNVFWQVGSSVTIGSGSTFVGTVMALTSITVATGSTVDGRMLARNGQVSLDTTTFVSSGCEPADDGGGGGATTTPTTDDTVTDTSTGSTTDATPTTDTTPETTAATTTDTSPVTTTTALTPATSPPVSGTTSAPVTSVPPANASPPLAYTAAGPATIPALITGLGLTSVGAALAWRFRRRGAH